MGRSERVILSFFSPWLLQDEGWRASKGCRHKSAPDYQPPHPQEEGEPPARVEVAKAAGTSLQPNTPALPWGAAELQK